MVLPPLVYDGLSHVAPGVRLSGVDSLPQSPQVVVMLPSAFVDLVILGPAEQQVDGCAAVRRVAGRGRGP